MAVAAISSKERGVLSTAQCRRQCCCCRRLGSRSLARECTCADSQLLSKRQRRQDGRKEDVGGGRQDPASQQVGLRSGVLPGHGHTAAASI